MKLSLLSYLIICVGVAVAACDQQIAPESRTEQTLGANAVTEEFLPADTPAMPIQVGFKHFDAKEEIRSGALSLRIANNLTDTAVTADVSVRFAGFWNDKRVVELGSVELGPGAEDTLEIAALDIPIQPVSGLARAKAIVDLSIENPDGSVQTRRYFSAEAHYRHSDDYAQLTLVPSAALETGAERFMFGAADVEASRAMPLGRIAEDGGFRAVRGQNAPVRRNEEGKLLLVPHAVSFGQPNLAGAEVNHD